MTVNFETSWFSMIQFDKSANRIFRRAKSMQMYWNNLAVTGDYPEIKIAVSNDRVGSKIEATIIPDVGNNLNDSLFFDFVDKYSFIKVIFEKKTALTGWLNIVISYI